MNKNDLYLAAADVQALYPNSNVRRDLVKKGIRQALQLCSDYTPTVNKPVSGAYHVLFEQCGRPEQQQILQPG